jgi:hypothetical protein
MMEAVSTSETSVNFYEIPQHNAPEDCHVHTLTAVRIRNLIVHFHQQFHSWDWHNTEWDMQGTEPAKVYSKPRILKMYY